jgi:hypothetical protein
MPILPAKHKPKAMLCIGERTSKTKPPMRLFHPLDGGNDYICTECGWCQVSVAGGYAELCLCATWWNWDTDPFTRRQYNRFATIARNGGYQIPATPPHRADD